YFPGISPLKENSPWLPVMTASVVPTRVTRAPASAGPRSAARTTPVIAPRGTDWGWPWPGATTGNSTSNAATGTNRDPSDMTITLERAEAPVGIEPTNGGFADLCLTTWLRRRSREGAIPPPEPQADTALSLAPPKRNDEPHCTIRTLSMK